MANTINSGSLQGLQMGQTLLLQARKVNGGKIQLEFAEIVQSRSNTVNPLALFNKSDDRFSQAGARRAWLTAEQKDASAYLGVDVSDNNADWEVDGSGREILSLNIINPTITINGEKRALKVQVTETVTPSDWQAQNIDTSAKRRGKDGAFITHKGCYIFANTSVVFDKAEHVFLEADAAASNSSMSGGIPVGVDPFTGEIFS
ncbi:MAG: hypothetical protein EBU90_25360 [Proteobacteria bacterium]|nr:hypothetical protein [Pseudomonadota bacterium]